MPHSLRVKIKGLRYKGIITDKDCDRLCKALDNEDILDKIRGEIVSDEEKWWYGVDNDCYMKLSDVLKIINKYKVKSEG